MTSFLKRKPRLLLSIAAGAAGALAAACSDGSDQFHGLIANSPDGGQDAQADAELTDSAVHSTDAGDGGDGESTVDAADTGPLGTVALPPDGGDAGDAASDASTHDAALDAQDQ